MSQVGTCVRQERLLLVGLGWEHRSFLFLLPGGEDKTQGLQQTDFPSENTVTCGDKAEEDANASRSQFILNVTMS